MNACRFDKYTAFQIVNSSVQTVVFHLRFPRNPPRAAILLPAVHVNQKRQSSTFASKHTHTHTKKNESAPQICEHVDPWRLLYWNGNRGNDEGNVRCVHGALQHDNKPNEMCLQPTRRQRWAVQQRRWKQGQKSIHPFPTAGVISELFP